MAHEFCDDVDGFVLRADGVQLDQLLVTQLLHDLSLGKEVLRVHGPYASHQSDIIIIIIIVILSPLFPCSAPVGLFPQLSVFTLATQLECWTIQSIYQPARLPFNHISVVSITVYTCV